MRQNRPAISGQNSLALTLNLNERQIVKAEKVWIDTLPLYGAAAGLAYHFRRDHFCEGSLISDSIANGCVLRLMERLYKLLTATP